MKEQIPADLRADVAELSKKLGYEVSDDSLCALAERTDYAVNEALIEIANNPDRPIAAEPSPIAMARESIVAKSRELWKNPRVRAAVGFCGLVASSMIVGAGIESLRNDR